MTGNSENTTFENSTVYTTNKDAVDKYVNRKRMVVGLVTGLIGAGATVLVGAIFYRLGKRAGENEYKNMY